MLRACAVTLVLLGRVAVADRADVLAGLQAWLDGTSTLDVRFQQSLVSGALGTTVTEGGRMYLERPGKLRWDYLDPERKVALLLGDRTALYLPDDRQLVRGRLTREQALFPRLLAGPERLADHFTGSVLATPSKGGQGSYRLRLVPTGESQSLAGITLTLHPPAFSIVGAELLDETGNRIRYSFSDARRNVPLPEGLFAFEPPPGTEVVDER